MAAENMVQNAIQPGEKSPNDDFTHWENGENDENCNEPEIVEMSAQLDKLNSVLDNLERKNDDIHAELVELLESNREARKQFQAKKVGNNSESPNV